MTHALRMQWIDLAFLHWRVPADVLRPLLPAGLELDLFDGTAWIGVTPFRMTKVRPVFSPPVPTATDFPELNVRTYARHGAHAGVWFFSLDAASWLAVNTARTAIGLPYFQARMKERRVGEEVHYDSRRKAADGPAPEFRARYRPTGQVYRSTVGSLDHWLTERYALFVEHGGKLWRLDIEHEPWSLQHGSVDIERNTMAIAAGITLPDETPHVRFSRQLDVMAHWPVRA
jgi:uncharacterized protein YqjF (DUF2071 family)